MHAGGVPILAQLALGNYRRPVDLGEYDEVDPDCMTLDDIRRVEDMFVSAAVRAGKAGFDGVQVHVAHFFFLSRFVSPAVNHRTDAYGGSPENRARIVTEIVRRIRDEVPGLHVSAKVNSNDFTYGGLEERGAMEICMELVRAGIGSIEVSGNGTSVSGVRAHRDEGYFGRFAAELAERTDVPVILVGGFRAKDTMEKWLAETGIAAISLSRPLVREPDLPLRFRNGESEVSKCVSCNRCYTTEGHRCYFNLRKAVRE